MASIKRYECKNGDDTWRVRFRNGRTSSSITFRTESEAEQFGRMVDEWGAKRALDFINEATEPRRNASGATVSMCVSEFIALKPNQGTRDAYTGWFNSSIQPVLGPMRIGELTDVHVQRWLNSQTGASATIRRNHKLLSAALAEAVRRGEIKANPATGLKIPRRPRNTSRQPLTPPFSREEYILIRKAIQPHYQTLVEFLGETGCRFGEAAALTPADVNLRGRTVHFNKTYSQNSLTGLYEVGPPKTEESDRVIKVNKSLLERLNLTGPYIFTTLRTNAPVKGGPFRANHWKRALSKAGLPAHRHGHPHDLRHAHATWLLDAGVPIHSIQKRLGHKNVMTTLAMYGHPSSDGEDRILSALEGL